jgi:prefoldin subunit 5
MEAELNELAQRAELLRKRVEAFQQDLGELTLPLRKVQADLEEIESFLAELAAAAIR